MSVKWINWGEIWVLKILDVKPVRIDEDGEQEIEFEDLSPEELQEFYGVEEGTNGELSRD